MNKVFAVFADPKALEEAVNTLARLEQLGQSVRVLTVDDGFSSPPALVTSVGRISTGVSLEARIEQVSLKMVETELMKEGITCGENRVIAGLVRRGGAILVAQVPTQEHTWIELLHDIGALHVAAVAEDKQVISSNPMPYLPAQQP